MDAKEDMLKLRNEAITLLSFMINPNSLGKSLVIERIVDCLISASVLSTAIVQRDAMNEINGDKNGNN